MDRLLGPGGGSRLCIRVWGVALWVEGLLPGLTTSGYSHSFQMELLGGQIQLVGHRVLTKSGSRAGW